MAATKAAQDQWFENIVGRPCDPDSAYGLQCVDLADDYCIVLFGNWQNTLRAGNARDLFNIASPVFFTKFLNDPRDPNQIPARGDIIIYGASRAVPEGHVAVVESSDQYGVSVIQQDGYLQVPAFRARLTYVLPNGAACIGWLRPKLEAPRQLATASQVQAAYMELLERPADQSGIDHYTRYTIDFVRADLQGSQEYRDLQARKAQTALAAADAEKRAAAERAEQNRIAEEQAAADRLKAQAEQQVAAVQAAKQNVVVVANVPKLSPASHPPLPTQPTPKVPLLKTPLVRFLFAFSSALLATVTKKKV